MDMVQIISFAFICQKQSLRNASILTLPRPTNLKDFIPEWKDFPAPETETFGKTQCNFFWKPSQNDASFKLCHDLRSSI